MTPTELTVRAHGICQPRKEEGEGRYTLTIVPEHTVTLEEVAVTFAFPFEKGDALFLNGYQSWTYSPERGVREVDNSLKHCPKKLEKQYAFSRYGDGHFYPLRYRKGLLHGYTYAYIRRGEEFVLFGSLAEASGFTRIVFDTKADAVRFEKDCAGRVIEDEYRALDLFSATGSEQEVFDAYFAALGIAAMPAPPSTGYTSWYNCYQDISEARIESDLAGMESLPVKPDIFQIDDGYEPFVGDWLASDPAKFPNGTAPIAEKIAAAGYRPGIWLAPFVCEKASALYNDHPDWLLRGEDGEPFHCGCNWGGAYALDFYNEGLRDYLRQVFDKYKKEGFTLFKLDFLYAACVLPRPDKTRGEIMDEAMAFLREVCGTAQILGCGVPLAPAFGRVEYCRIGPDVSLDYDDKPYMRLFHAERPSTRQTMRNSLFRRQLSGRAFLNDPDVFILRDENTSLTREQKATLGTVNALCGGLLFASDEFARYDEDKRALYRSFLEARQGRILGVRREKDTFVVRYTVGGKIEELRLT